jgi:protein-tyrosine phosphatase
MSWTTRWLQWPDFRLPKDKQAARHSLEEAWAEATMRRVEIGCSGGRGRTGTALACLAVLDGVPPEDAVAYVRRHYDHRAVETPWQRSYVARFRPY